MGEIVKYLWVNLNDLSHPSMQIPVLGSPLSLMAHESLGDGLLPGAYYHPDRLDDCFVIVRCSDDDRPQAIADALELIGKRKIGRKVRTRITANPPGKTWRFTAPKGYPSANDQSD